VPSTAPDPRRRLSPHGCPRRVTQQEWQPPPGHRRNTRVPVAEVTKKARHGSYYRDDEYAGRPDRIYAWRGSFLRWLPNRFHPDGKWEQWDIGEYPNYERAEVLLSINFRYLGRKGSANYKTNQAIATLIEALRRGERIHHSPDLRRELRELREATWADYPDRCVVGEHHRPDECGECPLDDDEDDSGPIPEREGPQGLETPATVARGGSSGSPCLKGSCVISAVKSATSVAAWLCQILSPKC